MEGLLFIEGDWEASGMTRAGILVAHEVSASRGTIFIVTIYISTGINTGGSRLTSNHMPPTPTYLCLHLYVLGGS
jgi:hypothetical protein